MSELKTIEQEADVSQTTQYGGVDLTLHPILKAAYRVACLIEKCGASPALTKASCAAFDLLTPLQVLVLQLNDEREARDKWRAKFEEAIRNEPNP